MICLEARKATPGHVAGKRTLLELFQCVCVYIIYMTSSFRIFVFVALHPNGESFEDWAV